MIIDKRMSAMFDMATRLLLEFEDDYIRINNKEPSDETLDSMYEILYAKCLNKEREQFLPKQKVIKVMYPTSPSIMASCENF